MPARQITISEEKQAYEEKLNSLMDKYSKILFVCVDNVRSQQIHDVRRELRGKALLVMGKKTLQAKIVKNRAEAEGASENDKKFHETSVELGLLTKNTGLLFTNAEINEVTAIMEKHRIQAPARAGAVAPCDVVVPAGNTGLEPTQTSFFQALNIATKITKGTVEIISDKKVLTVGDRVDTSTAALLQKLKISPFFYQVEILSVWDRGVLFTSDDLKITDAAVEKAMLEGISSVSALSLGAGIPTAASLPIVATEAFKNLLSAAIATGYSFTEFGAEKIIADAREGKLAAAAPAAAAATTAAAPAAAAKAPVEEEDDDDFGMGGLF